MTSRLRTPSQLTGALLAGALLALTLTGCSSGADSQSSDAGAADRQLSGGDAAVEAPAEAPAETDTSGSAGQGADTSVEIPEEDVIKTAVVSLRSEDVAADRAEVQKIIDVHRGAIGDEETASDGEGGIERSRMVIRVPNAEFREAVAALEEVGELESSDTTTEDVGAQVVDVEARIRAQEQSLERIEALLGQASGLPQLFRIESELTRRQSDLDALKSQREYLREQTALSTITVHLTEIPEKQAAPPAEEDRTGFLAGLSGGWKALSAMGTALATVVGVLLPFAALGVAVGVPTWLVVRRVLRRRVRTWIPTAPGSPS